MLKIKKLTKDIFSLAILVLFIQGCTSTVQIDEKGRAIIHNFGYVRVVLPPKYASRDSEGKPLEFTSTGIKTLGIQGGKDGVAIGYSSRSLLNVPLECHLVVIVNDEAQLQHLLDTFDHLKGEQLCFTVSSD